MKRLFKLLPALAFTGIGLLSCESTVADLNIDPNNFAETSTTLLLNHGVLNIASIQEAEPARLSGMWTDQFDGNDRQYITQDGYGVSDATFNAMWADFYRDGLSQVIIAERQAEMAGQQPLVGMAQLLQGYYAAEAALLWGDVPFTEVNVSDIKDPAYEGQMTVLEGAIARIETGVAKMVTSGGNPQPITFQNQVLSSTSDWLDFANALKARYLLALKRYDEALLAAEASGIDEASEDVDIIHTRNNFGENLFYQFEAEQRADYLAFNGCYLIRVLRDTGAVTRFSEKTVDTNRRNFFSNSIEYLNVSPSGYFAADYNYPIVSVPEVQLIIAEAAVRAGDMDKAVTALNTARNYWDELMGTDDYKDFVVSDFADEDALLKEVMLEKFVSVFGTPTFHDVIRTNNLVGTDLDGREMPAQRFLYPATESSSNSSFPGLKSLDEPTPINE